MLQRVGASEDSRRESVTRERDAASVSHNTPGTTVTRKQENIPHLFSRHSTATNMEGIATNMGDGWVNSHR